MPDEDNKLQRRQENSYGILDPVVHPRGHPKHTVIQCICMYSFQSMAGTKGNFLSLKVRL